MDETLVDASTASTAVATERAAHAPQSVTAATAEADSGAADSVASGARAAEHTALADHLKYTLTVPQAQERFERERRRVPSERTLQDYCSKQTIAAIKIRTSIEGKARTEWLINEESLSEYIDKEPELRIAEPPRTSEPAPHAAQSIPVRAADPIDVTAYSGARAASVAPAEPQRVGERRTLAEVLIENARLLAESEGKDELIRELKSDRDVHLKDLRDDRDFLRDEVREARTTKKDVKDIAERLLETIRDMANAPRLNASAGQSRPTPATFRETNEG